MSQFEFFNGEPRGSVACLDRITVAHDYTRVTSLVHYLLHHVLAYACRHKFGPLNFSSKFLINSRRIRRFGPYSNSSNTQVWSISNRKNPRAVLMPRDHKLFELAGFIHFFCSKWTKLAYSTRIYHAIKKFEGKVSGPNL